MLKKKLVRTFVLVSGIVPVAVLLDYIANIVLFYTPHLFDPIGTSIIAAVVGFPVVYFLISQRIDTQLIKEQLSESEARYRLLADRSPDVIVRYDVQGNVEYLSEAARQYGWEVDGRNLAAVLHPDELDRNAAFLADLAAGRPVPQGEQNTWRAQAADGRWVSFEGRSSPIVGDDGGVVGAVAVLRDVTERLALQAELSANEQKLRGLFELAPLGIALTDMLGRYVEFNAAFRDICGYDEEELRSLDYWKLTPDKYADYEQLQLKQLAETGRYGPYEKEYARKDGTLVPVRLNGMLVSGSSGDQYIWSIVEDISAQRRSEAVLIEARTAAEAANRAKSEFLANMSHEIRTPLNGVVGVAGALRRTHLDPRQAEMVSVIEDSAESLQVLLADILDLARVEAGRLEITPEPFDLRDAVNSIAELFRGKAEEKGLSLNVDVTAEAAQRHLGDKVRIKQIVGNLLSNAVKFTARGSVDLRVRADPLPDGRRQVRFAVTDTGIGFDEKVREGLFSRFVQADGSITRRFGGTGLGLSISGALAELMGGSIAAVSRPGEGSTFVLTLPLAMTNAQDVEPPNARAGSQALMNEAPLRVLAAEDHEVNRRVLQLMFEGLSVDMTMAENGQQALERFGEARFDLILMDMQMPVMDGLQAIVAIRSKEQSEALVRTPIIMLTANALPEHEAAGRASGADAFVTKPISAQDLLETIEATLADAALTRAA